MQKLLYLAVLFSLSVSTGKSQVVTYDMKNGPPLAPDHGVDPVKNRSMVTLKLINVNRLRNTPVITGVKVSSLTPIPKQLQTLFDLPDPAKSATDAADGTAKTTAAGTEMKNVTSSPAIAASTTLKAELDKLIVLCDDFNTKARLVSDIRFRRVDLIAIGQMDWKTHADLTAKLPVALSSTVMHDQIQDFLNAYHKAETQYEVARNAATDGSPERKRIEKALALFEEGYDQINEKELQTVITDILVLQNAFTDPDYFTFMSAPLQADDCDFLEFGVSVVPNQGASFLPVGNASSFSVSVPVRGGWKADFSTGLNFSFGENAKDDHYYLEPTSGGKGKLIKGENVASMRPGVAVMVHAYPRTGRNCAVGIMTGIGAGFKADNVLLAQYFLGGSLILGKSQRILLNSGVSFIPVSRLKSGYVASEASTTSAAQYVLESTKIDDVTEKVLRGSFFIGLSYNITKQVVLK